MMQDGKALQMGTSHYLGQNFAKSADVQFLDSAGKLEYVYATSWGVSTRLVGALIMTHSDDNGLVLPPALAPIQAVVVPIYKTDEEKARTLEEGRKVRDELKAQGVAVRLDDRDGVTPGAKYYEWESKGVPLRIEVGPKDLEKGSLCLVRRFLLEQPGETDVQRRKRSKSFLPRAEALASVGPTLKAMQGELLARAKALREKRTRVIDTIADYERFFKEEGGGFAWVHWAGGPAEEDEMAKRFETSVRCIPLPEDVPEAARGEGACILTGKPSAGRVVMAKSY
jgi:prolyl-tRNA synthetase